MSLSSEAKKRLCESLQQQYLNQKSAEYNEAKRLFIGLTDLDYKPGHKEHTFYKYWLTSNGHTSSFDRNDTALLDAYQPEEIYSQQKPDPTNPKVPSLDGKKITQEDLLSRILVACADALNLIPDYNYLVQPKENYSMIWPRTFSSEEPVKEFQPIDDENALSRGANLVIAKYRWLQIGKIEKGFINFQAQSVCGAEGSASKECPICDVKHDKDQLYGFIHQNGHFILKCYRQKQYKPDHKGLSFDKVLDKVELKEKPEWRLCERLPKAVSTPQQFPELPGESINIKEMEDALDAFPDFLSEEPSTTLICSTVAQSGANLPCTIWVSYRKTLSNESEAKLKELEKFDFKIGQYQNIVADLKTREWDLIIVQVESILRLDFQGGRSCIAILDEANATMRQMSSGVHARESSNAMRDLLNVATHVVAMDAFANDSTLAFLKSYRGENVRVIDNKYQPRQGEIVKLLYDLDKGSEAIRRGLRMLQEGKHVAFVMTSCKKARALANQASKLQKPDGSFILSRVYFGQMDGKQRQDDFANIDATWSSLDCVIYTSTVEAGISFEISGYFDAVIGITNITTQVHVEAFAQMLFRIRDCPLRMVSLYHSKKFDIFKEPCRELIRAELSALRPGDLPTAIKGQREWNKIAD
ncbi:35296_t:CDS:2, partial [Gigaspora margarita]